MLAEKYSSLVRLFVFQEHKEREFLKHLYSIKISVKLIAAYAEFVKCWDWSFTTYSKN